MPEKMEKVIRLRDTNKIYDTMKYKTHYVHTAWKQ